MPGELQFFPRAEILSYEELVRIAALCKRMGIDKIRLTGGEPLVRRDVPVLVRALRALPGLRDISLTTNGARLQELAAELYDAGLRRLNVSLDSLDPGTFPPITPPPSLHLVLAGPSSPTRSHSSP